jgi:hypothetical protein
MKLILYRAWNNDNETLGILSLNNTEECFILEDQYQDEKVSGETRIPSGTYKISLRKEGRLNAKYAEKFPSFHQGMLHLENIPDFKYVYIHIGNDDDDTLGCLLTGRLAEIKGGKVTLVNSTDAYKELYNKVVNYAKDNSLFIQII